MPGIFLPDGSQTETLQTLTLPLRDPTNPDASVTFKLPVPTDTASLQLDTIAKTLIYTFNEVVNLRTMLADVSAKLDALAAAQHTPATQAPHVVSSSGKVHLSPNLREPRRLR